ncbi:MAG: hypothetical protein HGB10_03025 [Coriobacteriia bacterium]|nr:hypothetical protein [Coriobacteriia bacterium]
MKKRVSLVFALALLLCLALPVAALALGTVSVTGIASTHTLSKGAALAETGKLVGDPSASNWDRHVKVRVQRLVGDEWVTLKSVVPSPNGTFKFSLAAPVPGSYRVRFPGCEHYAAKNRNFKLKWDPALSISTPSFYPGTMLFARGFYWFNLQAHIESTVPAKYLKTGSLALRSYASTDGVTFTQVYTSPNGTTFRGSNEITAAPIPVPETDPADGMTVYRYFRVRATWSGNGYTGSDTVLSPTFDMRPL